MSPRREDLNTLVSRDFKPFLSFSAIWSGLVTLGDVKGEKELKSVKGFLLLEVLVWCLWSDSSFGLPVECWRIKTVAVITKNGKENLLSIFKNGIR